LELLRRGGDQLCTGSLELRVRTELVLAWARGRPGRILEQLAHHALKLAVTMLADQIWQPGRCFLVEVGKGCWQLVQGPRESSYVFSVPEVGHEGDLGGLLLQIAAQLSAANAATQLLLLSAEEVLGDVVGPLYHGDYPTLLVQLGGMSKQVGAVLPQVAENEPSGGLRPLRPFLLGRDTPLEVGGVLVNGFFDLLESK
jgi:hypothetical protein